MKLTLHSNKAIITLALTSITLALTGCFDGSPVPAVDGATSGADGPATGTPALDPDSLIFYDLPINSLRYAVSGMEPTSGQCVTLVWFINETTGGDYHLCGLDPTPTSARPYAIVAPPTPPTPTPSNPQYGARLCEVWDYGPNATVEDVAGCVDFTTEWPVTGSVDMIVTLDSPALSGDVVIRSL